MGEGEQQAEVHGLSDMALTDQHVSVRTQSTELLCWRKPGVLTW